MANSGAALMVPGFITHNETPWLDNKHTVFGCVVSGQDVLDPIEQDDVMESITIIREGSKDFDANKVFNEGIEEEEEEKIEQKKAMEKLTKFSVTESGLGYKVISKGRDQNPLLNKKYNKL